ncbi:leukotriene B4 receptor 1-like [Cheilinus undulatus]|uniref:leukotriene B4 receptor 1-like n=1 Tax=Cheilinus undulatus TaxID=241271 RepID=UPI001BD2391B|nr:leukotriene B4 receptor 1-like [Cheilinus undulatus]XP_041660831.1 leukotriene B4 receptor 1-like [Cheilinus undulatus]
MDPLNFTVATLNSSFPEHPPHASSRLLPAVVLSLCFLFGVPGNIAVMVLKPNRQHMSSLSLSLMLNLAVSDLLCLLPLPLWIYILLNSWTLGLLACKLLMYVMTCSVYCSLLTVLTLSVQRYLQVVHKKKLLKTGGRRRLLTLLWLAAMILSIPALVVRQTITDEISTKCLPLYSSQTQKVVVLLTESLLELTSVSAVVLSYIQICRKVEQATFFNNPQTNRLITSIIVTFLVFWVPYLIINVIDLAASVFQSERLMKFCADNWNNVGALTFVNSCLNPLLYAFASRNICGGCFKSEYKSSCWCKSSTTQEVENMSSF